MRRELRSWQLEAFAAWSNIRRGVASVTTGAGKTTFALKCIELIHEESPSTRILIVVPSVALMDQWRSALSLELGVPDDQIGYIGGGNAKAKGETIVIAIINSIRANTHPILRESPFLIVDEVHRAASKNNRQFLRNKFSSCLGLSATPERQYDYWFEEYVAPVVGHVFFEYPYARAVEDGVVVPYILWNVGVTAGPEESKGLDANRRAIARHRSELKKLGIDNDEKLIRLFLRRSTLIQRVRARIPATVGLVESLQGRPGMIFHESISAAEQIFQILQKKNHRAVIYHSKMSAPQRYLNLRLFSLGQADVIVTCRALDEGLDVPRAEFGIISAGTKSRRQQIQRLGRVVRSSDRKSEAIVAHLYVQDYENPHDDSSGQGIEGVKSIRNFSVEQS